MLIVCPSCASEYTIDPGQIGAQGRKVRCAACRTPWFVDPAPEAEPLAVEATAARAEETPAKAKKPRKVKAPVRAKLPGLAALADATARPLRALSRPIALALVLVLAVGLVAGRAGVVQAFPRSAALYAHIGLPVNLRGLEFRAVKAETEPVSGGTVLLVDGEVIGAARGETPVPPIAIALKGSDGQALYTWTVDPPRETVSQGEVARFKARLASPPADAREVLVQFARPGLTPATP
ncbi:MAG TPA: zinc-ribbon domain-containing protein [Beijerinckiaceae bacterium]|jgi:predicted Zn finger-like uncharacterized protein